MAEIKFSYCFTLLVYIYYINGQLNKNEFNFVTEDVESMTGEIENGDLAVRDVADLLQHQYAIITGKLISIINMFNQAE